MSKYTNYRKKNLQPMRPVTTDDAILYANGEISVSVEDEVEFMGFLEGANDGGMVAVNPGNYRDMWYVSKQFFEANYEEAGDGAVLTVMD